MLLPDSNFDRDLYLFLHFSFLNSSTRQPSPDEAQLNDIRKRLDEALALGAPPGFKVFLDANSGDDDDDDDSLPIEYRESQRGKPCGHVFEQGEGVYHCRTCALDPTCVFCYRCFHASNHENHDTEFSISSGNGGCCDCGDAEAWKIQPDCEYHSVQKSTEEALDEISDHRMGGSALPESLSASIRKTIATVMDFIVDTLNASPAPSNALLDIETVRSKNPPDLVPKPSSLQAGDEMVYACFLWNDEQHSFDEVIDKVMTATRKSRQFAVKVADSVDSVGRDVVSASPSLNRIIYTAKEVSSPARTAHGGLTVSIRAVPDVHREAVAGMALEWFRTVLKRTVGNQTFQDQEFQSVSDFARVCICEELGAPRRPIREIFAGRSYDEAQFSHSDYQPLRLDYFLAFESKLWKSVRNTLKELYISTMIVVGDEFKKTLARRFAQSYLMIAHSYLMKDREWDLSIINLSVQLFTVPTIAAHLVEKTNVVAVLFDLLKTLFMSDAYPEACNLSKFFKAFQTGHSVKLPHYPKLHCERNDIYRTYQYDHVFHDVQYLLGTPQVAASIFRKSNLDGLDAFLDLCCLLQGMNPQQREETVHVAYESLGWIGAFPVSINICNMIDRMLDTFAPTTMENVEADFTHLLTAIRKVNQKLDLWCAHEQQSELMTLLRADPARYENSTAYDTWKHVSFVSGIESKIIHYNVAKLEASFHYPMQWLLSGLLTLVPKYMVAMRSSALARQFNAAELFVDETPLDAVTTRDEPDSSFQPHIPARDADGANDMEVDIDTTLDISENLTNLAAHDRVLRIMEYPLRVEVLLAQVHSGLWVRNGQAMRDQVHTFANHLLRDLGDHYLYLLQFSFALLGTDRYLAAMLDKFGLMEWFSGQSAHLAYTQRINQRQLNVLVEDFLLKMIFVLTERAKCTAMPTEAQIRRELIHVLAVNSNGMQFSKIGELIPDRLTRDRPLSSDIVVEDGRPVEFQATSKSLETILKELATFKFPDNASDIGLYELETEYLTEVDAWFQHYNPTQRSSLEAVFTKHAEARLKDVPKDFILTSFVAGEDSQQLKKAYRFRVRPPKVVWVEEPSVFSEMNYMSLKPSFLKIAFFGLYNLTKVEKPIVSDKIMAAIVHLLLYAVENDVLLLEKNSETDTFSAKAVNVIFTVTEERGNFTSSIFDLVLNVLNRYDEENFKDYVDKFTYIASQITKLSKSLADPKIRSWRDNHRLRSEEDNTAAVKEEKARRKEANKKRQAALMAQFENQQKAFMQNFAEDEDFINEKVFKEGVEDSDVTMESTIEAIPNEREKEFGAGNCIVCQEEMVVGTKEYGYLSLMQTCQMERARFLNFQDPDHLRALILRGGSLDVEDKSNALTPSGKSPPSTPLKELKRMQSAASVKSGASSSRRDPKAAQYVIPPPLPAVERTPELYVSTCGHQMHLSCFDVYKNSVIARATLNDERNFAENIERHEFLCPLCKSLGNCIVPVLAKSVKEYVNWNGSRAGTDDFGSADSKMGQLEMWFKERSPTIEKLLLEKNGERASTPTEAPAEASLLEPPSSPTNQGMIGRFMTFFRRRGSITPQSAAPLASPAERRSEGSVRLISGIFSYIFPTLEIITKASKQGSFYDRLLASVTGTVSGIERGARGIASKSSNFRMDHGRNGFKRVDVLETVGHQTLAVLRLISCAVLQLRPFEKSFSEGSSMKRNAQNLLSYVFRPVTAEEESLLIKDAFENFVEHTIIYDFEGDFGLEDGFRSLTIFWIIEVMRFLVAALESIWVGDDTWDSLNAEESTSAMERNVFPEDLESLKQFVMSIMAPFCQVSPDLVQAFVDVVDFKRICDLLRIVTLPFLRKSSIYFAVKFNVVPPSGDNGFGYENPAEDAFKTNSIDEFDHLRAYLNLPDIFEIARWSLMETGADLTRAIVARCLNNLKDKCFLESECQFGLSFTEKKETRPTFSRSIVLKDPLPFRLIALPQKLETLFEDCFKRVCNRCNRNIPEPGLCLVCGAFVCARSFCCQEQDLGECNIHMRECSGEIGAFFLIKKFRILLLHVEKGHFKEPPYLDSHGEVDLSMRKGRLQFLHERRYEDIIRLWASHTIAPTVARAVDATPYYGTWTIF